MRSPTCPNCPSDNVFYCANSPENNILVCPCSHCAHWTVSFLPQSMQSAGMRQEALPPKASTLNPSSSEALTVKYQSTAALKPCPHNSRTHSKRQIRQIANSIERFGFTDPILVDSHSMILAGNGRLEAAKLLRIDRVPTIQLEDLTICRRPDRVHWSTK